MHPEALSGVEWALQGARFPDKLRWPIQALDLGGANINGTAKGVVNRHVPEPPEGANLVIVWRSWDIEAGPGITRVVDATAPNTFKDAWGMFDLILCTEVMEHVEHWRVVVQSAQHLLTPGGLFIMTCASTGRRPHGSRGELDPAPGEWYQNVPLSQVDFELGYWFSEYETKYNPNPGDVYAWGRV
jgi:SAM-dependent methyltransferase